MRRVEKRDGAKFEKNTAAVFPAGGVSYYAISGGFTGQQRGKA